MQISTCAGIFEHQAGSWSPLNSDQKNQAASLYAAHWISEKSNSNCFYMKAILTIFQSYFQQFRTLFKWRIWTFVTFFVPVAVWILSKFLPFGMMDFLIQRKLLSRFRRPWTSLKSKLLLRWTTEFRLEVGFGSSEFELLMFDFWFKSFEWEFPLRFLKKKRNLLVKGNKAAQF